MNNKLNVFKSTHNDTTSSYKQTFTAPTFATLNSPRDSNDTKDGGIILTARLNP